MPFLIGGLLLAAGCGRWWGAGASDGVPTRVVLVTIDTLRADHVGCYGDADAETPVLDALARKGVRFDLAQSPAPLTLPSHTTLLTGLDPPDHGSRHNGLFRLRDDVPTLQGALSRQGYATAAFVSAFVLEHRFGLSRGFDSYDDALGLSAPGHEGAGVEARRGDRTVAAALTWLEHAPDRFFLWVHLYDVHAPYAPPQPYAARHAPYDGEVAFADAQVGRLLSAVDEHFGAGTLVVVTSDHGESLGEHGELSHSHTIYDATQRVPLIMLGPGLPAGRTVASVVSLADVAPTVLDLLDLEPLPGPETRGRSLLPAISGKPLRQLAWNETLATQFDLGWSPLLGVRTRTHRYIRAPKPELYDLSSDSGELHNIAAAHPALVAKLDAAVARRSEGRPVIPNRTPGAQERAQLAALGYVLGKPADPDPSLGRVGGPNPRDEMPKMEAFHRATRLLGEGRGAEALAALAGFGDLGYSMEMVRGEAALLAGDADRAQRSAERALAIGPADAAPWTLLGQVKELRGNLSKARDTYRHAAAIDPDAASPLLGLGRIAEREGDRDAARKLYQTARALPIVDSEAIWRLAALEIEDGKTSAAAGLLALLPPREIRRPAVAVRLAQAERQAGRYKMAEIRVSGALLSDPKYAPLWQEQGEIQDELGALPDALAAREEFLLLKPTSAGAQEAVARSLAETRGDLARARQLIEGALAKAGRVAPLLDTLSRVQLLQGESAEALATAKEGLQGGATGASRVDLLYRRAEALAALGRPREARAALDEARAAGGARRPSWTRTYKALLSSLSQQA